MLNQEIGDHTHSLSCNCGFITYHAIVSYGAVMESVKGYILSLIPAVPISISVMIKQKLQREIVKINKHKGRQLKTVLVK